MIKGVQKSAVNTGVMDHLCSSLVSILEDIRVRCFELEARVGVARSARLMEWMYRGETLVENILRMWVQGVAMEHTNDPDVLCTVFILLDLFVAEARGLGKVEYRTLRVFCIRWIHQCILRLGVGVVMSKNINGGIGIIAV